MQKALFKKQLMEVNAWLLRDRKSGKRRGRLGIAMVILLYAALFLFIGSIFYVMGEMLCKPLVSAGLGWLYFVIMGLGAAALSVIGSVFSAYSSLYNAKDSEMLLAMPIPPSRILIVRLFGVWLWCLLYAAIVFVPALLVYWKVLRTMSGLTFAVLLFDSILLLLLSVFVLTLACILGWVVAKVGARLKNKTFMTVLTALLLLMLYYWGYVKVNTALQHMIANAHSVGEKIKGVVYPFYLMGRAGEGAVVPMLLFTLLVAVLFGVVYWVMACTFFKMAVANQAVHKRKYRAAAVKARSGKNALLWKEFKRFLSSPIYMLNCGLGVLLMPAAGIFLLVKAEWIQDFLASYPKQAPALALLLVCAALCNMAAMNDITAPSVSLEGKNLWLVQSLPIPAWQVLMAKLRLHLWVTEIPVVFCAICCILVLRPSILGAVLVLLLPMLFVLLSAVFGLTLNLIAPNFKWVNEVVPIKQSMAALLSVLGGMVFVLLLAFLYYPLRRVVAAEVYLAFCTLLVAGLSLLLLFWLKNKGTRIFERL